jgi:TPR repeat protein
MCTSRLMAVAFMAMMIAACGKSAETLEQECKGRVAASCFELGEKYFTGSGVTEDTNQAVQFYERACEGRESRGCDKARRMFQESCDAGRAVGCSNLGRIYLDGFGVPPDAAKAAEFYDKACGLNDAISCSNLAMLYADGNGVSGNPAKASELYAKACQSGFTDACQKVARQESAVADAPRGGFDCGSIQSKRLAVSL